MTNNLQFLEQVERKTKPLISEVLVDDYTNIAQECFDFKFDGINKFYPYYKPNLIPNNFNIGLIVGNSGSGKSTLLKDFGVEKKIEWNNEKAIISHFESKDDAIDKLNAVGLCSVPTWTKPFYVLSEGEKFRANLSRRLENNSIIDEYTSVVDRNVAKSCSVSISKYIRKNNLSNIVFCTCHKDVIEWLKPDWVFDTDTGTLYDGRLLRQPKIELSIFKCRTKVWETFKSHHYLSSDINKASDCYVIYWGEVEVGFMSILPLPHALLSRTFRVHRLVILPEYQGMGLGTKILDTFGSMYEEKGKKLYIKTIHKKLNSFLESSILWMKNTKSGTRVPQKMWKIEVDKVSPSYQYVGKDYQKEHFIVYFNNKDKFQDKMIEKLKFILEKYKDKYIEVLIDEYTNEITSFIEDFGIRNNIKTNRKVDYIVDENNLLLDNIKKKNIIVELFDF